ncbi:hypothetical protein WBG78_26450 [Chryseolinea sp. T2]|uniref:HYC_CC_PP family protein n=1 Tax=Chryseolinea sp. T2 TaxID=3129255 RepID=UPI003076C2DD
MKRLRPIVTLMLAVLVLISGTSFIVGVHRCGGHVASVALFSKAEPCGMEMQMPPCHKPVKPCCSDESVVHDGDDFKPASVNIHVAPSPLIAELASPVVISILVPELPAIQFPHIDSSPPTAAPDINLVMGKFQI